MAEVVSIVFVLSIAIALKLMSQRGQETTVSLFWNAIWVPARFCCAVAVTYIPAFGVAYWTWIHVHWLLALVLVLIIGLATLLMLTLAYLTIAETGTILREGIPEAHRTALQFQSQIQDKAPSSG
ncbi:MAG: hypothetical protein AAB343_03310 [Patescibacteria group bacterium]